MFKWLCKVTSYYLSNFLGEQSRDKNDEHYLTVWGNFILTNKNNIAE